MIYWDIEGDGLLPKFTTVHCLCLAEDDGPVEYYHDDPTISPRDGSLRDGVARLEGADEICGHSSRHYDSYALKRIFPDARLPHAHVDTLTTARFLFPDKHMLGDAKRKGIPKKKYGTHGLKIWGIRLGEHKGDFDGPWDRFSEEMLLYCGQDVIVTRALHRKVAPRAAAYRPQLWWEHQFADICARQAECGFPFNADTCHRLLAKMELRFDELEGHLIEHGPPKVTPGKKYKKLYRGRTHAEDKVEDFNPNSDAQVVDWFKSRGWEPKIMTDSGAPSVKEEVLATLTFPEAMMIAEYRGFTKHMALLRRWLEEDRDGRVSAVAIHNGTVTHRCAHIIVANVPTDRVEYAAEFRSCFEVPKGKLLGWDAKSLELRMLAHRLAQFDETFVGVVLEGKAKEFICDLLQLPWKKAKVVFYAWLYGAGDAKIGYSVSGKWSRKLGAKTRSELERGVPGLKKLILSIQTQAKRGFLLGADGRRVKCRSGHSALNTALQSDGAIAMKYATVRQHKWLESRGVRIYRPFGGEYDFAQVGHFHDEGQDEVLAHFDLVEQSARESLPWAGRYLKMRCPLEADLIWGKTWQQTH